MKVKELVENPLLRRKAFVISTKGDKTISRKEAKERVAKLLGVEEKLVIIKRIVTKFGGTETIIIGKVYENEEVLKKYARPYLIKRNTFKEEKSENNEESN